MARGKNRDGFAQAIKLLSEQGVETSDCITNKIDEYIRLVAEWNPYASLVSEGDVSRLLDNHVTDSLSLAPLIGPWLRHDKGWLDIGSGGGFPVLPVKLVLPHISVTMVERSEKKVGFLRKCVGALGLEDLEIVHGEFPVAVEGVTPGVITARAVEKPERLHRRIAPFVADGAVFFHQARVVEPLWDRFHVEPIRDQWDALGLRRGKLAIIQPQQND